jgi:hypothetical protein
MKIRRLTYSRHTLLEGVRNLLGDAGTAKARVEALDLEDCSNQFL